MGVSQNMVARIEAGPDLSMLQAHQAERVYDRAEIEAPPEAAKLAVAGLRAVALAIDVAARCSGADPRAALTSARGEAPTMERALKAGGERVQTGLIDSAQGASAAALRVRQAWPPETLYRRGALSRRHYCAAERLVELWESAQFDRVGAQSWDMPVDKSGGGGGYESERLVAARRAFGLVWSVLLPVERHVLGSVVIDARTIERASENPLVRALSGSGDPKRQSSAAATLMRLALERCANLLFDGS